MSPITIMDAVSGGPYSGSAGFRCSSAASLESGAFRVKPVAANINPVSADINISFNRVFLISELQK